MLPFNNMSDDPEQDYFCDGISEDILTALSKLRWFLVIARNSSFTYKGKAVHIRQIAEELGVRYVVEGSVRKAGDRVRITAQLNDATTGSHLWAEHYDRDLVDVFAVQDEITNAIVAAIEPQIYAAENFRAGEAAGQSRRLGSPDAGAVALLAGDARGPRGGAGAAGKSDRDRSELRPGAGAAGRQPYVRRASRLGRSCDRRARSPSARRWRRLPPISEDAWAHAALGSVYFSTRRLDDALSEFELALQLNPNFCLAQGYYALALSYAGRTEDSYRGGAARHPPQPARSLVPRSFTASPPMPGS